MNAEGLANADALTALAYLYQKQNKQADLEKVYVERLKVVQELVSGSVMVRATDISENRKAALIYLQALSDLTNFYRRQNRIADAIQAYRGLLTVDRNLIDSIVNPTVLGEYVTQLDAFQSLLKGPESGERTR